MDGYHDNGCYQQTHQNGEDRAQADEALLTDFLRLTQPVRVWQDELLALVRTYITRDDYMQALRFFSHVMQAGIKAYEKREVQMAKHGRHSKDTIVWVEVKDELMPKVLDMDRWKRVLIALGFEVEEPDGYHRREDMSLALGRGVMRAVLEGMLLVLAGLQETPWNYLTMLVRLSRDEAISLDQMLQAADGELVPNQKEAKNLSAKYPSEIKQLGFEVKNKCFVKTPQTRNADLQLVIHGLFKGSSDNGHVFV